eukprot:COSAG03_NODE_16919_length_388_cov_1.429066_2_plen_54_part_01
MDLSIQRMCFARNSYSVEGWQKDPALEAEVVAAFRTCIDLFGTKRCMVHTPTLS